MKTKLRKFPSVVLESLTHDQLLARAAKLTAALEQFAGVDLNPDNCASLEVANRRIRAISIAALSIP